MTECDYHPTYKDVSGSSSSGSVGAPKIIQDELIWGLSYRQIKKREKDMALPTKKSPLDIPFKICREKERERKRKRARSADDVIAEYEKFAEKMKATDGKAIRSKTAESKATRSKTAESKATRSKTAESKATRGKTAESKATRGKTADSTATRGKTADSKSKDKTEKGKQDKPPERKKAKKGKPRKEKPKKDLTLLERSVLSQNKYMDYLAIPNIREGKKRSKRDKCPRPCYIEPCSPRVVQLAVPRKRSVFANWKAYYNFLPTVMIMRYEKILHTDKNLEPKEARYYYKKLDKKKRKQLRLKRILLKKKKAEKEKGDQVWLNEQIKLTMRAIVDYLIDEPLFALNYKQLMLSDGILDHLDYCNILKKPSRGTKNNFKRTVIEFSDKIAIWMDILTRFVDIQAVDSDEDIPPISISSLEGEEGESETSSYYSEIDKGLWDQFGEGEGGEGGLGLSPSQLLGDLFGEGEDEMEGFLGDLDLDLLEKLIRILSNCSDEYLEGEVNPDRMPGVRYIDILNRVKELRDGILKRGPQKPFLEQLMLDWAIRNEPDEIDQKMRVKIHETAALLGDFLFGGGFGRRGYGEGYGLYGEGEGEGGEGGDETGLLSGAGWGEDGLSDEERMRRDEEERRRREEAERLRREEEERRRREAEERRLAALEAEAGGQADMDLEKEQALYAGLGAGEGEGMEIIEDLMGKGEVAVLFEAKPGEGLEGRIIKGHKPSVILEHRPDMVCCLSLKTWAVWLLEITHNAHNWTKWVHCIIQQIREFAAIVRGDVLLPNGERKVLYKEDWIKFAKEADEKIIAWRQYSAHVKELSNNIIENFHGKKVLNCCPKCLQDHLIRDVVHAHETLQALTEAMDCAENWQKTLDEIVQKTCRLSDLEAIEKLAGMSSSSSSTTTTVSEESEESIYEIEELDPSAFGPQRPQGPPGPCTPAQGRGGPPMGRGGPPMGRAAPASQARRPPQKTCGPPPSGEDDKSSKDAAGPSQRGCQPRQKK